MVQQRRRTMYRTGHAYRNKRPSDFPEVVRILVELQTGTFEQQRHKSLKTKILSN